jgi:hypothetical protein
MPNSQTNQLTDDELITVSGGTKSQAELRQMAQQYCPVTYDKFKNEKTITRPMAEKCLDEAGYGWAKFKLNEYFPRR